MYGTSSVPWPSAKTGSLVRPRIITYLSGARRVLVALEFQKVRGSEDNWANRKGGIHDDLFYENARRVGFGIPPLSVGESNRNTPRRRP